MNQRSSLVEWISQTRKVSKEIDYICCDMIDSVINSLQFVEFEIIKNNKDFFYMLCRKYHKPNPTDLIKKSYKRKLKSEIPCTLCRKGKSCKESFNEYIEDSIRQCKRGLEMVKWQWWEVIDFMYERPELVNSSILDDYVRTKIYEVCRDNRKNNPLENGTAKRFGKMYRDKEGNWKPERRKRW